jgi:adenylate cyclase
MAESGTALSLDLPQRAFTWLYGRLGKRYPAAFITLELQASWLITLGTLLLYSVYFDVSHSDAVILVSVGMGLTGVTVAIGVARALHWMKPLKRWIAGDRSPASTAEAWSTAVGLPLEIIRRDMWLPILGVALPGSIIGVIVLHLSPFSFVPIFAGALVAIGYSGILHYFAIEAGLRPVLVDINRDISPRMQTGRKALSMRVKLMGALPLINVITGVVASALSGGSQGGGSGLGIAVLAATAVAFTISFELSVLLSKSILRPIGAMEHAIEQVRIGNLDVWVPVTTADELGELSAAFNQMIAGLAERERIREAFGTYLDHEVAEYILSDSYRPEGFEADVSVLFCDVKNFTAFASHSEAQRVVAALNELFEAVVPVIARNGGHVDKFVGDGLLAVFGAPEPYADHADRAVRSAVEIAQCVNHVDGIEVEVGLGVNSGTVVAGSIGGAGRLNFSVIGDAVNVAARVEAATRELEDEVLITAETRDRLSSQIDVVSRGARMLKGKGEPVELFAPVVETVEQPLSAGGPGEEPAAEATV